MSNGWFEPPADPRRPAPRVNPQRPQPGQRQPLPRPRHWRPLVYRCSSTGCDKEYLTPEARQHHVYHAHGAGDRRKASKSYDIDMGMYLGLERSRGFRHWLGKIFGRL